MTFLFPLETPHILTTGMTCGVDWTSPGWGRSGGSGRPETLRLAASMTALCTSHSTRLVLAPRLAGSGGGARTRREPRCAAGARSAPLEGPVLSLVGRHPQGSAWAPASRAPWTDRAGFDAWSSAGCRVGAGSPSVPVHLDFPSVPVEAGLISIYPGAPASHASTTPCVCPLLSAFPGHQTRGRSLEGAERPALDCGSQSLVSVLGGT